MLGLFNADALIWNLDSTLNSSSKLRGLEQALSHYRSKPWTHPQISQSQHKMCGKESGLQSNDQNLVWTTWPHYPLRTWDSSSMAAIVCTSSRTAVFLVYAINQKLEAILQDLDLKIALRYREIIPIDPWYSLTTKDCDESFISRVRFACPGRSSLHLTDNCPRSRWTMLRVSVIFVVLLPAQTV